MENKKETGKVMIVSATDGFLARSLVTKLEGVDIHAVFVHAQIKEIRENLQGTELMLLFMSEELELIPEVAVYLNDLLQDIGLSLFLIGEKDQYNALKKSINEEYIREWFTRPLDMDGLIKKISVYLDENTGEKRKKNVLIVDDDITYMRTVYEWLKGSYRVGMASSGVQAISYLAKNKADLILLDYEMPIANGPQVLSMLKNDSDTGQIPVMFLTGHGEKESVLSVIDLEPVEYLLKTIDKEGLLEKINKFFKESKR